MQENEEKIKVMFAITKGVWGGAQKYVFELATELSRDKYAVSVVHGIGDILPQKLSEYSIPSFYIDSLGRDIDFSNDLKSFFKLLDIFKKSRPDVTHLNSSKIGGIGAIAARFAGVKKIILTVHGFAFNEDRPWAQKKIIIFLSWLSIVFCTDVIFISETEMDRAIKWPFIKNKAHLVHNGISKQNFQTQGDARKFIAQIHNISEKVFENKTVIGTIGELTKNKGLKYAIEAVENIPDIIYFIIGDGEEEKHLKELSGMNGGDGKIFFTGFVQNASQYLKAFDIFVLPSIKEGLPFVLLEAGLAELPVVASAIGGIPEIIENGVSGILVEAGNVAKIAESLKNLALEPQKRAELGDALKEKIEREFSLEKMIEETEKIYN